MLLVIFTSCMSIYQVKQFIRKELITEWRQRYAINGILLQVLASVLIVYLAAKILSNPAWNAIYWLIMVFVSIQSISKSFIAESKGKNLYYHQLIKPQNLLIAKFIYHSFLNGIIALVCLLFYSILMGNPVAIMGYYLLATLLGCIGFSATFTLISGIASKAGNSSMLMPVLSLPVIIPLLLILIKACKRAMDGTDPSQIGKDMIVLFIFNGLLIGLAYMLFPSLWKE
jgi:heme exporter protein B